MAKRSAIARAVLATSFMCCLPPYAGLDEGQSDYIAHDEPTTACAAREARVRKLHPLPLLTRSRLARALGSLGCLKLAGAGSASSKWPTRARLQRRRPKALTLRLCRVKGAE